MSILNDIWNRIAGKPDKRKATATEAAGTENRVYAVATEEGVMLFSGTPKGMKARNSYLQHLADGFFNMAKVPETLRIYELELPTKRVAELADNCIEKLSKTDLRSTDGQLRKSVVSFTPDKFADRSVLDGGVCKEKFDLRPDFHNFDRLTKEFGLGISPRNYDVAALLYISENGYTGLVAADLLQSEFHITDGEFRLGARMNWAERAETLRPVLHPHSEEEKAGKSPETYRRWEAPEQKPSDRQRQAKHVASITPQNKKKKELIL